jgi:biopolymer transport protein ExbD
MAARAPRRAPISLNLTSMIDVVFLLMTYFLLIAQFHPREQAFAAENPVREEAKVDAADSASFDLPERPIEMTLRSVGDAPNEYVLGIQSPLLTDAGPISTFEELTRTLVLKRAKMLSLDQVFIVHAARDARWEHALGAMAALRSAGFEQIRFGSEIQ